MSYNTLLETLSEIRVVWSYNLYIVKENRHSASKGTPWSSSTGETVVVIQRRKADGIQTADGWLMGFQGESELHPLAMGFLGELGGSHEW